MLTVHQILWSNQEATGLEHCYSRYSAAEIMADGLVIGVEDGVAFRIRYQVCCDLGWQVRKVVVTSLDETEQTIHFVADGLGNWTTAAGLRTDRLFGCRYCCNAFYQHTADSAVESKRR